MVVLGRGMCYTGPSRTTSYLHLFIKSPGITFGNLIIIHLPSFVSFVICLFGVWYSLHPFPPSAKRSQNTLSLSFTISLSSFLSFFHLLLSVPLFSLIYFRSKLKIELSENHYTKEEKDIRQWQVHL